MIQPTREQIENILKGYVWDISGIPFKDIKGDSLFRMELNFDSVDELTFFIYCEDGFDFEIPDADAEKIKTFGQAVEYVEKHMEA